MTSPPGDLPSNPATPPRSGALVPAQARWHGRLAARIVWGLIHLLALTLRWRTNDRSGLFARGTRQPALFVIWHNRLALCLIIHQRYVRAATQTDRRMAALVSASRDGGLLARVLELFGVIPIRGSSSRRGGPALRELVGAARAGHDLALTPDGPRGPVYQMQPGVIAAAQLTGLPIVPVCYRLSWKKCLRSWDRFQIPLPFSRCAVEFGEAMRVPADATEATREQLRQELEKVLRAMTHD